MFRRLTNNKGIGVVGIILIAAAVVAVVVIVGFLTDGFGLGGGQGDGEGEGNVSAEQSSDTEEPELVVEELDFLNVTVSENEYLYQNSRFQLDELVDKLVTDAADTKVKITDENASKRAYENLINALEEKNIRYIKADV